MGTVRIMKFKNQEKYFVLKSIRKDYVIRHNDMRHITNEKNILYALHSHPFIVNIFGTFQDKQNVYFALQYVPGGELYKKLMKSKRFSPQVSKFYVTEIVAALAHIHRMGYVFRDLKPENVLIDEEGHCKLVDFGFAIKCGGRKLDNGEEEKMHTLCGTPAYLSPEQLDGKLTNGYTRVVDWWSVGVLTYELLTGRTPFCHSPSESHYEIFLRIISATHINFPFDFSSDAKQLVSQLCHVQLSKRLTDVDEILRHPYFVLDWAAVERRDIVPPHVPRLKDIGDVHYFDQYGDSSGTAVNSHNNNTTGGAEAAPVADFFDF
jgi:protein kinase A